MEIHTSVKLIRACWDAAIGLLGSNASGVIKGLFYRCFQVSWAKTIDLHQITAAWHGSAISPQGKTVMRAVTLLSTVFPTRIVLATPETTRTLQALDRAVRRVLVEGDKAFLKVSKAFAEIEAENVLLRKRFGPAGGCANLRKLLNMQASSQGSRKAKSSVRCSGHCMEMSWQSAAGREMARDKGEKREKQP
jgi:hypothetical protein